MAKSPYTNKDNIHKMQQYLEGVVDPTISLESSKRINLHKFCIPKKKKKKRMTQE